MRTTVVLIIAAIHAAYFALAVTKEGVKEAAKRYGRELILCCQTLMPNARASTPRKAARKPTTMKTGGNTNTRVAKTSRKRAPCAPRCRSQVENNCAAPNRAVEAFVL